MMTPNRAGGSVTASGTKMAPIHRQASAATTKSTELGKRRATRSPSTHAAGAQAGGHPGRLVEQSSP